MKLTPSEPDLATLYGRIARGDLDLQPGFQRQEVWPDAKRRRLIDTILRGWHVPPIHVVEVSDAKKEVLDGQQRLVAIRDFMSGRLRVDGHTPPPDPAVERLNGFRYTDLPDDVRRRFDGYAIRLITLSDYRPEEPGELFFRLNQQTSLTPPEQRNAFFGPARDQVRLLVRECERTMGLQKQLVGFTNSRMAYDDMVARLCEAIEVGTLHKKITAAAITERYRDRAPYGETTVERARKALKSLLLVLAARKRSYALNKATAHSWLVFFAAAQSDKELDEARDAEFAEDLELTRVSLRTGLSDPGASRDWSGMGGDATFLLRLYNDRASSRVADVSSVLVRDYVTWALYRGFREQSGCPILSASPRQSLLNRWRLFLKESRDSTEASESLATALERAEWGLRL